MTKFIKLSPELKKELKEKGVLTLILEAMLVPLLMFGIWAVLTLLNAMQGV